MSRNPILMPKLGLTMEEGTLSSWSVREGDQVNLGDTLFVVETDKIANEVDAREEGTISEIVVGEGQTVPVGAVLAYWEGPSPSSPQAASSAAPFPARVAKVPVPNVLASRGTLPAADRVYSTPLARRMAKQAGLDIATICGSGPNGRIKAVDIERRVNAGSVPVIPADLSGYAVQPAPGIEKTIARRLTQSKQTIPHFYVLADADVTDLLALRKQLNTELAGPRISINHCIIAAIARALERMPDMNSVWTEDGIGNADAIAIGVAVDSPCGLLVPVLRDVGRIPLSLLARRAHELVGRAREGKLSSADLEGGAISVLNVGMYGVGHLVPIINPGQSAILGVGSTKRVFRPDAEGMPALREELGLVLSCDHRIHDGVRAARFLNKIVEALQTPMRLLV